MDIRNFFKPSPPLKGFRDVEQEKKKKVKKIIISDSESDDDGPKITSKQTKKSPAVNKTAKTKNGEIEKSKYFESLKPVKPRDVFSSAPVKQTPAPKQVKEVPKTTTINDGDDDFDELFLQLNDDDVTELIRKETERKSDDANVKNGEIEENNYCMNENSNSPEIEIDSKHSKTDGKKDNRKEKQEKNHHKKSPDKKDNRKEKHSHKNSSNEKEDSKKNNRKKKQENNFHKKSPDKKEDSKNDNRKYKQEKNAYKKSPDKKEDHISKDVSPKNDKEIVCNGYAKHSLKTNTHNTKKITNSCIDLSDSDSDVDFVKDIESKQRCEEKEKFGSKVCKKEKQSSSLLENNRIDSPEKKTSDTKVKETILNGKVKNTCIDMSDSNSSDDEMTSAKSPLKRKCAPDSLNSPKRRKIEEKPVEICQKRKFEDETIHKSKKIRNDSTASVTPKKTTAPIERQNFNRPPVQISELWVDKYRPSSLKQLIGQQGDKSIVKKLTNWLSKWNSNHSGNKKHQRPSPWAKDDDGAYFKAALLSGPPGIGKTTTAHLVCKELGFDMVEFNASDTRSKKLLHQEVSELLSSKSLAPFFTGSKAEVSRNHVLVMDEVDGMAGNEDRGGIQELIQLVKSSHVPIICMCNDRNHPKMRSLVNYCFDLRFSRPRVEQIKGAMMGICYKEGLKIAPDKLNEIIKSTDQDIRLILNHLSVLAAQKDTKLANSEKFVKLGPWDVLRKVFSEEESKKMSFNDKSDLFFHDYGIAPLFVQENYLNVVPHAKLSKIEKMNVFAKAAESICVGDLVDKAIRNRNAWSLLPVQAVFSSVVPGEVLKGHMGGQISFPSWLGKNSSKNKMDRLQQELLVHTRLRVSASKEAINLDYCNHLRDLIVRPLVEYGSEGVPQSLEALQNYDLLKDDLESLSELCKWPNSKDPMSKVESKVKAAFTRAYNKSSAPSPYAVSSVVKKGRSNAAVVDEEIYDEEEKEETVGEDEEENKDSIEVDAMISVKKKTGKKQDVNEPSTSKAKGAGSKRGRGRGK